jgi:competence protein ComEC
MAGILIGDYLFLPLMLLLATTGAVLLALLVSLRYRHQSFAFFLVLLLLFIVGLFIIQKPQYITGLDRHIVHLADQGEVTAEGVVLAIDQISPDKNALTVSCRRTIDGHSYFEATGKIRLIAPSDISIRYGDFIRFRSKIKQIHNFINPGSFNYQRRLNRQGIYVSGFIANQAAIIVLRHNTASGVKLQLENFRLYLKQLIHTHAPSPQKEILEAMILGNAKAIPQEVRDDFAKTGTSHILAISGLHIGLVAAAGFFLFFSLLKLSQYLMLRFNIVKIATAGAIVPVIIYALVAGLGTTVLRATLMALAFLTALLINRKRDLYNILFFVALTILVISPESLFEISFQLSFSAVLGLIYIVPKFSGWRPPLPSSTPKWLQKGIGQIYLFILVSAAATLGTLPIIVFYFNRVSAVTLIANLLAVPLLGMLALIPALAFILASLFSPGLAGMLISISSFFAGIAVTIIERLAALSWSSFSFTRPNIAEIALFYIFIFLLLELITTDDKKIKQGFPARYQLFSRIALLISVALFAADIAYLSLKDRFSKDLQITAIDVGQGSATFLRLPRGVTMLVDGGGFHNNSFDMGRSVIAPFLYARRIGKIDIVVLTHPHPDHLQGLIPIVNNFDVQEVWTTGVKANDDLYRLWEKSILEKKIPVRIFSAKNPPENINGVHFQCLWPAAPPPQNKQDISYDDTNDSSLVLKVTYGTTSFLFTGDISDRIESLLIDSRTNLQSDLLFVPHHGSLHSSSADFLQAVACRYAIISAGKNNVFRHPHPQVLDRYRFANVNVFRTDEKGAIRVNSDGKTLTVAPWKR